MTRHVAVLMGGWSAEREVSLRSGAACAKALEGEGFRVSLIDVDRTIAETLTRLKPDVAFNALHGRVGEDGTMQGILEVLRIPYNAFGRAGLGPGDAEGQGQAPHGGRRGAGGARNHGQPLRCRQAARSFRRPYVLKPVNEGSSVGVIIVKEDRTHPPQELGRADWPHGDLILAETFVGRARAHLRRDGRAGARRHRRPVQCR